MQLLLRSVQHLYELVRQRAQRWPGAVALGAQEGLGWRTLDSRTFLAQVDGLAQQLAERGVASGDRVVLWTPSGLRTPVYLFALWKLGAISVPFDRDMNPNAAQAIMQSVEPRVVLLGYEQHPSWAPASAVEWWEPKATPSADPWQPPDEELAAIFFTSGTTGQPKGCMISHVNLCSQVGAFADRIPLDDNCRLASILPLSHLFELTCGLLYPLSRGAAIHYIPSRRGGDVVRVLAEQRITHMMAVPQLLMLMGNALEQRLQSRLPDRRAPATDGRWWRRAAHRDAAPLGAAGGRRHPGLWHKRVLAGHRVRRAAADARGQCRSTVAGGRGAPVGRGRAPRARTERHARLLEGPDTHC